MLISLVPNFSWAVYHLYLNEQAALCIGSSYIWVLLATGMSWPANDTAPAAPQLFRPRQFAITTLSPSFSNDYVSRAFNQLIWWPHANLMYDTWHSSHGLILPQWITLESKRSSPKWTILGVSSPHQTTWWPIVDHRDHLPSDLGITWANQGLYKDYLRSIPLSFGEHGVILHPVNAWVHPLGKAS